MVNVVGISGLHLSIAFKQRAFPNLTANEAGVVFGHDSAAALVNDSGIIAAAAEERFNRQKATDAFPCNAIKYCLAEGRLEPSDIDYVAHGWMFDPYRSFHESMGEYPASRFRQVFSKEAQLRWLEQFLPGWNWQSKLVQVPHHIAHAASAFYPSGFDETLILVADGMGEQHSTTVAIGRGNEIDIVSQVPALHSLGILYGVFTLYLGFQFGQDEYKVMGLAPYGNPKRYLDKVLELIDFKPDGTFANPILYKNYTQEDREAYRGTIGQLARLFGPARQPESEITQHHKDLAASLQHALQISLLNILKHFQRQTGQRNLCMAGGVALNCSANGVIRRSGLFENIFIQPAAGDDGTALGAALYVHRQHRPATKLPRMKAPLLGPSFDQGAIRSALSARADCRWETVQDFDALAERVARRIAEGDIVAWFQGRMEYGPRALGSRSILADPRREDMRDRINALVKKREAFRPFAPAVSSELAAEYFEIDDPAEPSYAAMLMITHVRAAHRDRLPAVTHVDGSARVQIVSRDENLRFWTLLEQFRRITGIPILLNTSFNVRGQPIVCTPTEAIDTFLTANLDVLVLGDNVITRRSAESYVL